MNINYIEFAVLASPLVFIVSFILWKEQGTKLRLAWACFRSWFWWLTKYESGYPPFCEHIGMRMVCWCGCPFHVRERQSNVIVNYCRIARNLKTMKEVAK